MVSRRWPALSRLPCLSIVQVSYIVIEIGPALFAVLPSQIGDAPPICQEGSGVSPGVMGLPMCCGVGVEFEWGGGPRPHSRWSGARSEPEPLGIIRTPTSRVTIDAEIQRVYIEPRKKKCPVVCRAKTGLVLRWPQCRGPSRLVKSGSPAPGRTESRWIQDRHSGAPENSRNRAPRSRFVQIVHSLGVLHPMPVMALVVVHSHTPTGRAGPRAAKPPGGPSGGFIL